MEDDDDARKKGKEPKYVAQKMFLLLSGDKTKRRTWNQRWQPRRRRQP